MPARPGAGRPTKDNPDKRALILDAIATKKMPRYLAAKFARIHRDTLSSWLDKDPEFLAEIEQAEAQAAHGLLQVVTQDSNGAWKVLKNIQPEYFKDEVQVQQTNQFMISLQHPNGQATSIGFEVQPPSGAIGHLIESSSDSSSDLGDSGGQVHTGSILATDKDRRGS